MKLVLLEWNEKLVIQESVTGMLYYGFIGGRHRWGKRRKLAAKYESEIIVDGDVKRLMEYERECIASFL